MIKMIELPKFEFRTNIHKNQIYVNPNKQIIINIFLKNKSLKMFPRSKVELKYPSQLIIRKNSRNIGYIPAKEERKFRFKLKTQDKGVYDIEASLIRKNTVVDQFLVKLYVGVPLPIDQEVEEQDKLIPGISRRITAVQEINETSNNTPNSSLAYCPYCGQNIEVDARYCPNCGSKFNRS